MAVTKRGKEPRDDAPDSVIGLTWAVLGDAQRVRALAYLVVVACVPVAIICFTVITVTRAGSKEWSPRLLWPAGLVVCSLLIRLFVLVKKRIVNRRRGLRAAGRAPIERSPASSRKRSQPAKKNKK
jgi:hypothetical protein